MSEYNHYAKNLDKAFKEAREKYIAAYNRLEEAKREVNRSNLMQEYYVGEKAAKQARAAGELAEAKHNFDRVKTSCWEEFNNQKAELTEALLAKLKMDNRATPDAVDLAGVALLDSGALSADDFAGMAEKYDENPTMLKLIAKKAADKAAEESITREDRTQLMAIVAKAAEGKSAVLRAWDALCNGADRINGQRKMRDPDMVAQMCGKWEELMGSSIENF